MGKSIRNRSQLVPLTIELVQRLRAELDHSADDSAGSAAEDDWWLAIQDATGTTGECAEVHAQTTAVATAVLLLASDTLLTAQIRDWLLGSASPHWRGILQEAFDALLPVPDSTDSQTQTNKRVGARLRDFRQRLIEACNSELNPAHVSDRIAPTLDFYEHFLQAYDAGHRKRRGVFYTPRPVARYILEQVDQRLVDDFDLDSGLADTATWSQYVEQHAEVRVPANTPANSHLVSIMDPAVGAGVFLVEAIDLVFQRLASKWKSEGKNAKEIVDAWNNYVPDHLLPRLYGLDILLPACVVSHLLLAEKLADTGYRFENPVRVQIRLLNTLSGPTMFDRFQGLDFDSDHDREVTESRQQVYARPMAVIVGNPPFSGISQSNGSWITDLLRGKDPQTADCVSYYQVDGQPLGERKHWLQDDYAKFLRFAHWKIERAGLGIVGLITNHGYLDNPTFRGARCQLHRTFSSIDVLDLHGNRKKKEVSPDGSKDENVFQIEQGTAIGLFCKSASAEETTVRHAELWGEAKHKLELIGLDVRDESPLKWRPLQVGSPQYLFAPRNDLFAEEYAQAVSLIDLMPTNVTAPVTARDGFVVAFTREELIERLENFRNLSIPDEEIRKRYFNNSRSTKYPPGDTRGWKLGAARQQLASDDRWAERIRRCWYRPFDRRFIYWSKTMIDWPRDEVVRHLLAGPNLALVARRQMLPSQPCNYFWVVDSVTVDGIIRSDNRGSESIFPLYLYEPDSNGLLQRQANFDPEILARFPSWGNANLGTRVAEIEDNGFYERAFYYTYALFHSSIYRERYADLLRADFPRVPVPKTAELFSRLARLGRQLADAHLLHSAELPPSNDVADEDANWQVAPGCPKFADDRVVVSSRRGFEPVRCDFWEFHVGGHQICRKWLKDRRGRILTVEDRLTYRAIVAAIESTCNISREIGRVIEQAGSWQDVFALAMIPLNPLKNVH